MLKPLFALMLSLALSSISCAGQAADTYYVGAISGEQILSKFKKFEAHKNDVSFTQAQIRELSTLQVATTIKIFFGQWCHDSQREVPRIIRLFQQVDNPYIEVDYYALDIRKSDPEGLAQSFNIKRTPTIIVMQSGQELGRILEFPNQDWANDISALLKLRGSN